MTQFSRCIMLLIQFFFVLLLSLVVDKASGVAVGSLPLSAASTSFTRTSSSNPRHPVSARGLSRFGGGGGSSTATLGHLISTGQDGARPVFTRATHSSNNPPNSDEHFSFVTRPHAYLTYSTRFECSELNQAIPIHRKLFHQLRAVDWMKRSLVYALLPGDLGDAFLRSHYQQHHIVPFKQTRESCVEEYLRLATNNRTRDFLHDLNEELNGWVQKHDLSVDHNMLSRCLASSFQQEMHEFVSDFWEIRQMGAPLGEALIKDVLSVTETSWQDVDDLVQVYYHRALLPYSSLPDEKALASFCQKRARQLFLIFYSQARDAYQ